MKCRNCQTDINDDSRFCRNCGIPIGESEGKNFSHTRTIIHPQTDLPPGTQLSGKYEVIEVLGRGGMGVVYKAEDTKLKRKVALKFLPLDMMGNREARDRFLLEAQAAAALSHPNICTIHEIDEAGERNFIAMEFVEGKSLKDYIEQEPLSTDEVLNIAIQLAGGLEEAHKKKIVHRDIKSANIMISNDGLAKIMDFGLAKVRGGEQLTREGTTLGTVSYMSPEQASGDKVDHRSDIWSLGVVLFEMLLRELPFKGDREASILYSITHEEPKFLKSNDRSIPTGMQKIVEKALQKEPSARYASAAEMLKDLQAYQSILKAEEWSGLSLKNIFRILRRPKAAVPAAGLILLLILSAAWFFNRQAKIRWAKQVALPEIENLVDLSWRDYTDAYSLAEEAEKFIPKNPRLQELISMSSLKIDISTDPPGANISIKDYDSPDSEWKQLGFSPLEDVRLPVGIFRWKIEKEGYETALVASSTWAIGLVEGNLLDPNDLFFKLDKKNSLPEGMVRVIGSQTELGYFEDFFIDKFEVTNKQYKAFLDSGGYRVQKYWTLEFIKDGKKLSWEDAMAEFVDKTGRPGPSTWQAGDYPPGEENFPVSGISWYEAAAYAAFAGKSLPTGHHWGLARGEYTPMIDYPQLGGFAVLAPFSNFGGQGPAPAGFHSAITPSGAFDMAGNVREWCWNETVKGRLVRGGAWNDNTYMFGAMSQAPPFDRSSKNGFRCVLYPEPQNIPEDAFKKNELGETRDFYAETPVPDSIFQIYNEQYSYDKVDLNSRLEFRDDSSSDWVHEKVSYDAAYGGERIFGHLFLPKNTTPPYQAVIYFPGSGSVYQKSSENITSYFEFSVFLSFLIKNGRAVLYPVYKGTFERMNMTLAELSEGDDSYGYAEYQAQLVKDFKKSLDYLETREDIDPEKFAYYGISWGAAMGAVIPAVENRIKASVLVAGGMMGFRRPEADKLNYVSHVKTPTLMLNGKYDSIFIYEAHIKPMFDLLGPSEEHKKLIAYDTDHIPAMNDIIKETLSWLDRYLGPVK